MPLHPPARRENTMTLCPIALVAGCKKCPVVSVCPLKTVIGDFPKDAESRAKPSGKSSHAGKK
jgi:hypothetical protein